jgi:hypothetical protein
MQFCMTGCYAKSITIAQVQYGIAWYSYLLLRGFEVYIMEIIILSAHSKVSVLLSVSTIEGCPLYYE